MPKKIISDMVVPEKSIRQIPISAEKKRESKRLPKPRGTRKPGNPKVAIWILAIVAVLAFFFGISLLFSSATVSIKPRIEKLSFNNEAYTAKLDSTVPGELSFEILKLDQTESLSVEATEEKVANQKASGKAVVYNNYSSAVQRLISNTRFQAANGKIYRILNSVDVPGTKVLNGKTVPGSVEITLYADQPGDSYNLKLTDLAGDFKIPGFKGTPRYDTFYARLKTDIAGGLIGKQKIVADSVRLEAENKLKETLKEYLVKELYAVKPDSYIVFPNSYSVEFEKLPDSFSESESVKISLKGNLNAVIFSGQKLSNYLAIKKISGFDLRPTNLIFNEALSVSLIGKDSVLWKNKTLDLKLNGEAAIKWIYDTESIKKELVGKPSSMTTTILSKFKNSVSSISVVFRPVWARYFPDNIDKIKIIELDE